MTGVDVGIPLIISKGAFKKISDDISKYGAVHLEKITGVVTEIPRALDDCFVWKKHVPKYCLTINSPLFLKHIGMLKTIAAYVWTIYKFSEFKEFYCWKPFKLGMEGYEENILEAIEWIDQNVPGGEHALFDIDEKVSRLERALFTPSKVKDLFIREYNSYKNSKWEK